MNTTILEVLIQEGLIDKVKDLANMTTWLYMNSYLTEPQLCHFSGRIGQIISDLIDIELKAKSTA